MLDTVLIANRSEIARRVIRTLARLGVRSVAVYAPGDRDAPHVREADTAVAIGSYLDIEAMIAACTAAGADALHPGYGFLSENPALARACVSAGVTFVGPPAQASELMGDKLRAKEVAREAGVPVVPGFTEDEARRADYPLLVKAAAGGGGRGMRVVERVDDLDAALAAARREALAGFGDNRVFIERFLPRARHLEVQVIADAHGHVVHLGERECSLQRRHQKVIEESPSPAVGDELRATLGAEAVALMRAGGYVNAGTVEFVADANDPAEHYFLECNARLQVEHPVTELVCGVDLVELQLRIAAGEPLPFAQDEVSFRGHAIEARVCAEDAARDFLPAAGRVLSYRRPDGVGVRIDDGIETGSAVDTTYDSLLAKVVVHADDRPAALARLDRALAQTSLLGVTTTIGFLRSLLAVDAVRDGELDTGLIERLPALTPPFDDEQVARATAALLLAESAPADLSDDPFHRVDGWRLGGGRADSWWRLAVGAAEPIEIRLAAGATADGRWLLAHDGGTVWVGRDGYEWSVRPASAAEARAGLSDGELRAPMPGQVLLVQASVGDRVRAGDPVVVLESMKMELVMSAPVDGAVAAVNVAVGDRVIVDQPLARVEAVSSP
jgi:acetyl-CoA/propionyl-CoA carboxylase, biotin carboxylase, biotin carboxyl carrier protein